MNKLGPVLCNILAWIPFLILVSLLVIPCSLFFIYRIFITVILRRLLYKNLLEPIANQDYGFSTDDIWKHPLSGIAFAHILDGSLQADLVQNRVQQAIFGENKVGTVTKYDRLTSVTPCVWLGFPFWKKVKQFDIADHIRVFEPAQGDEEILNVDGILKEWLQSPFGRNQPAWDILVIPDFINENGGRFSLFGFRIHHVVGDGYSMLEFLKKIFDEDSQEQIIETSVERRMSVAGKLKMYFWMPSTIGKHFSDFLFHSDYFSTTKASGNISVTRIRLNLSDLKTIRRKLSESAQVPVPFIVVILFVFGGALRKFVLSDFPNRTRVGSEIFKNVNFAIGLPKSKPHPIGNFCNHWAHGVYEIPIGDASSIKRLMTMTRKFSNLRNSNAFEMNSYFTNLYSILPQCIYSPLLQNLKSTTIGVANLPGPSKPVQLLGKMVVEKYPLLGLQLKNASFTLACFSYNNQVTLSMVSNQEVFDHKLGEKLLGKYFQEEVEELLAGGIQDDTLV